MEEKLSTVPGIILYGETHGYTGKFPYGVNPGSVGLRFFDAMNSKSRVYLDAPDFFALCEKLDLPTVPVLYKGPWSKELVNHANGKSTIADHIREGFVVRPMKERFDMECGRVILKMHGEEFLLKH